VIVERVGGMDPLSVPGVLVAGHGPFTWGASPLEAVRNAARLEYIARLASETMRIDPEAKSIPDALLEKHFHRKHGPGAYYGQEKPS
jgi:L-ribulose-5-phosphate 4-epimerase